MIIILYKELTRGAVRRRNQLFTEEINGYEECVSLGNLAETVVQVLTMRIIRDGQVPQGARRDAASRYEHPARIEAAGQWLTRIGQSTWVKRHILHVRIRAS